MKKIINFDSINIKLSGKKILSEANLTVNENEFVFLTGNVGSGKTSLLRAIYADIDITADYANVLDFNLLKIKKNQIPFLRRNIGFIFQDFKFLTDRTLEKNLRFVLEATGWTDNQKITNRIEEVLADVEMLDKKKSMPFELSGGEQQRASFARAMLNSPKIILADEPTGNLDEQTGVYITQKLIEQSEKGTAVVFVTHNMQLVEKFSDYKKIRIENKKITVL